MSSAVCGGFGGISAYSTSQVEGIIWASLGVTSLAEKDASAHPWFVVDVDVNFVFLTRLLLKLIEENGSC